MSLKYHLLDLPDEVLLSMAINLSLADLLSFMHSCRRFSVMIAQSPLMQYLIRVMRNGLYDPLITEMSIPQRVEELEIWERAWIELSLRDPSHLVQNGILIGSRLNGLSGSYCYLDFSHLLGQSSIVSRVNIPNVGGDAHVQSWTYVPESDLIAIIFQADRRRGPPKIQLHQFSTGSKHPSASNYSLEFDQILTARATCVDCCGENMVAVILDGENMGGRRDDYVFLVEWKIGRITQLQTAEPGTYGTLVTFLSSDSLVFALRDAFALQVCKLTRAGNNSTPILQTICSLQLPGLLSGQQIADLRLAQPSPLSGNYPPSTQHSLSSFPFRSDPEDDILAFEIFFRDDHGRRIIFVARRRTLLSLASPTGSGASTPPYTRAWEDWGPRTTHWMELDPVNDSMSLAGSRCVLVKYSHLRNHFVLDLRDFNPYRIRARRARNSNSNSNNNSKAMTTAGITTLAVLSAEACFEEDVVSELLFVSIRKENVGSRVFLDDEWMAEILWDRELQAQVIQFRTVTSPAEVGAR
ncbi:hypothetical protein F5888DRAFT_1711808 [Russula emetica]|nr:hypothetical protein F5888DRAFT_1711808 [Russula emetica]